jgi:hypothetical protein
MKHLPIWHISKIPTQVVDIAVAEFELLPAKDAVMGAYGEIINSHQRDTTVRFASLNHWFGGILFEHALASNLICKWHYDIKFHEAIQFAEYGKDQHYNWHVDNFPLSELPNERKITVICLMNDPSDFEGGEFNIRLYQDYVAPLSKGDIIAFPSILEHRVTPITNGKRLSATMWLNGPRFK